MASPTWPSPARAGDGQVGLAIAIPVSAGDLRGGKAGGIVAFDGEGPVSPAKQDGNGAVVGDGQIELAVAIEIGGDAHGRCGEGVRVAGSEVIGGRGTYRLVEDRRSARSARGVAGI